jgi:adenosylmethionine-8-amino-7-oxononanoate aminotransferase
LGRCDALDCVVDVRVKGALGVVELAENIDVYPLRKKFLEKNLFIRPFGHVIYLAPPFVISEKELKELCDGIFAVLQKS